MKNWFKKKACKWGIHSFKVEITYLEYPPFYKSRCLWCENENTMAFGEPPTEVLAVHDKMMEARSEAYKKLSN